MRTLIVGFDALDPVMFDRFREDMPTLDAFPTCKKILSTDPALTYNAWPTALVGTDVTPRLQWQDDGKVGMPLDLWKGAFWEHSPWSTGIVNVPCTWGQKTRLRTDSYFVAGLAPAAHKAFVNCPPQIVGCWPIVGLGSDNGRFSEHMLPVLLTAERVVVDLLTMWGPDVETLIVGFMSPDYIGHVLHDQEGPMLECYKEADFKLSVLMERLNPERTIVFSDHGMMPIGECESRDYPKDYAKRGIDIGHTGGHRRYGLYAETIPLGREAPVNMWDVYHRIVADWPDVTPAEEAVAYERMKNLGYAR